MGKSPSFMRETFCIFGERLRQVEAKTCLIHDPVEKRVAATLLSLQRKFGKIIPLTRQEVAELAGTTVETTIRTISRFKKEGWIRSTRGKIELLNPQRLGDLSG